MPSLGVAENASCATELGVAIHLSHGPEHVRGSAPSSSGPPDDVSWLGVLGFLGKLLGAVAALKAAEYLLRALCAVMAWKSGGASHSELVGNLRSECDRSGDIIGHRLCRVPSIGAVTARCCLCTCVC